MTTIRKIDNIILTYYVNPHHFYFKYKNDQLGDEILSSINNKIEKYVDRHIEKRHAIPYVPQMGEIVLCHYITDCVNKWIRARVDMKMSYDKDLFILWAIDHGFPIASESRWIRPIPFDELKVVEKGLIFKAGLFEIVPSTVEWNFLESVEESRKTKKWSSRAVQAVEKYLHEADDLTFKCRAYFEDHFFGSLVIRSISGTQLVVEDFLKSLKEGVESLNFLKEFSRLEDQPYWQRQTQDSIYKVYENNSDQSGSKDVTAVWISSDDSLNKNATQSALPKALNKIDQKSDQPEETMINLSHQLNTATASTKSSLRNFSSNSRKVTDVKDCANNDVIMPVIPMKNRLAEAQRKMVEQGKMTARKEAAIDEINKKVMALTFPAGFIVDTKAIQDKYKYLAKNNQSNSADNESERKKNDLRYQMAVENEECSLITHPDRILVHNHEDFPTRRINDIHDAHFSQDVHIALKELNINQIFRIQTVGWPGILRGSSMMFVNSERTGKTWTYLPAICTLTIQRIQDQQIVEGCGPLSIIACATSKEVNRVATHLEHLLRYNDLGIKCFKAYGLENDENVVSHLLNGTEILVATFPCLYRLMADELNLFSKERIISLVLDNIDLVYERFGREIREIHKSLCDPASNVQSESAIHSYNLFLPTNSDCNKYGKKCSHERPDKFHIFPIKLIVTSRTWLKILENFYIESDSVTLCIGSYIEAAVYAKTEMTIKLLGQKFKIDQLIANVQNMNYRLELTIVICRTSDEVKELLEKLKPMSIDIWHCHDKSDSSEITKIKKLTENCKSGHFSLLICTDEVLRDLDIRCAQHIVHYSLPASWTMFAFRFSTLFDHHKNLLSKKSDDKPTTSMVFLDEDNNDELPRLIDFMQMRVNCVIPERILKFADLKRIEKEEKESNIYKPFCNDLVTIGACHGQFTCRQRHILTKFDRSRNEIPQTGYVKFDVIAVHSPVHYTVRLLAHRQPHEMNWTKMQSADEYSSFNIEMMKYFEDTENHVMHLPIALGDLCVVELAGETLYERGQILKIEEKKSLAKTTQYWVDILLIDSNERMSCFSTELLRLPDKFKSFPFQAVDVRIAGIVPRDFDNEFDAKILALVRQWIRNDNPHYCQGFIKLSIMNTLWVDSIEVTEVLHSIKEKVSTVSIKRNLLERKFCVRDSKPLQMLTGLAENADLLKIKDADRADGSTTHQQQIVELRGTENETQIFKKSDDEDFDVDESNPSVLNWTSSSDSENDDVHLNLTKSTHDNDFLGLSQDKWAELTASQFNKVILSDFYHPNRIYIRNDSYSLSFMELNKCIDAFVEVQENLIPLSNVALAENCLAKIGDRFGRAKILKLFHNADRITAEVFYVDFGEFLILPTTELMEIPIKFITALPFQAIFCKLIGIRPSDNKAKWCDNVCDKIYDELLDKQVHFYASSLQPGIPDKYTYGLKSRSYELLLLDGTGDININKWIVSNGYGEWDPATKHFADIVVNGILLALLNRQSSNESEMESVDIPMVVDVGLDKEEDVSFDVQFDENDLIKLLQLQGNDFPVIFNEPLPAQIEEIHESISTNPAVVDDETHKGRTSSVEKLSPVADDKIGVNATKYYELVSEHKFPKIKWHQTDQIVVLTVHAPDIKDYFLKITPQTAELCFIHDQEKFAALLNLFGCVDVPYTTHEIRGLNIVIRLVKTLKRISWPRLIRVKEKAHWIQYNFEADRCNEQEEIAIGGVDGDLMRQLNNDSFSSSDVDDNDDDPEISGELYSDI